MNDGYSICLNKWALDKEIKNELNLLLIVSSLCAEKGYCFATNAYLANLFDITEVSISTKLKKLEKKQYISIDYEKRGCEVIGRKIRLKNILTDDLKNFNSTIKKNFKENNIINNSKENSIINNTKRSSFIKPTIEEIQEYCYERNNYIDAYTFYDFYESKNWFIGKNKMKDWKAAIRTWEKRDNKTPKTLPNWYNKEIKNQELDEESAKEFNNFIEEFRK